ncbi:MAG TPA: tyrosine--tRNA ligase [Firmicutes bacterium]|nr:tyrosine--tRNA ligase [Bacillota bacterium]
MSVFDVLQERGFIKQVVHEEELKKILSTEKIAAYVGFDPTADSFHAGHLVSIMGLTHLQRAGHKAIAIVGGGTGMIGDPSGRTELRQMLTKEKIAYNVSQLKNQLSRYLDFSDDRAVMENNADWILPLNYVDFLREIGIHFSVNRMLTAECFRSRMERGLTFIEFNYMLLQAYDFLMLYRKHGCILQLGGDDQWANILAGADLIRRVERKEAYGITWPLLTTASGKKMGKTEAGAVWLDSKRTSVYDFYQYWRNTDDADVERFLGLFTFLPMDEVRRLGALKDQEINEAKRILAFEVTKLAHGEEEAEKAQSTADALFAGAGSEQALPSTKIKIGDYPKGIALLDLLVLTGLAPSKKEGRRLIEQGGIKVNQNTVDDVKTVISLEDFLDRSLLLRKGKKTHHRIEVI